MTFQSFLESVNDLKLYDVFFHSSYFQYLFWIQWTYVCYYLRVSPSRNGLQWWRSLILGLLFSYGPRALFIWLTSINAAEKKDLNFILQVYIGIWLLMNISPFDIVFKFINHLTVRSVLAFFAEFVNAQLLIIHVHIGGIVYQYQSPLVVFFVVIAPYTFPIIIDVIDNTIFSTRKRKFMLYPCTYLIRVGLLIIIALFLSDPILFPGLENKALYTILPYVSIASGALKLLDILVEGGNVFKIFDFVLPILCALFTYHADK